MFVWTKHNIFGRLNIVLDKLLVIKWKTQKKYHTVGTVPKSNRKSQKEGKSISLTQKHDYSLSWLGTGTVKSGEVKRVLLARRALPF